MCSNGNNDRSEMSNGRPVSFYDNYGENGILDRRDMSTMTAGAEEDDEDENFEPREIKFEVDQLPSQLYCLKTTVPQNIVSANIAGRHTPTRNSLRHSRMIVMNKSGKVPWKSLPPIIRYHRLAKALVGFQLFLGVALSFLALWLFIWSPNIRNRDNPYWCAFPLVLSGLTGLLLLCCCRKEYPGMPAGYCIYFNKVISIIISLVAGTACWTESAFALLHLISIALMNCAPMDKLSQTCVCKLDDDSPLPIKSYHYLDLSCPEVNILSILLIFSCVTNAIAGLISLWYVYLHWSSRYMYTYSKVRTKNNSPVIISNS